MGSGLPDCVRLLSAGYCLRSTDHLPFSYFDHTGDIGVRLSGRTLDALFRDAAVSFTESVAESARVQPRESIPVALEAPGVDLLLVDWLSEILYHFDVRQVLVADADVHITEFSGPELKPGAHPSVWRLQATLRGEVFDPARHPIKVLIKAVTYHALEVREDEHGWHATVVFDI